MNQKITFFTGKGGVGKSMLAAAWAESRRRLGKKVLLVELGPTSFFAEAFRWPNPGLKAQEVEPGLSLSRWQGVEVLKEYVGHLLKSEWLTHLFLENKVMRTFLEVAPGLRELALMGKITSGLRNVGPALTYDEIVVDGFSTGHALALLRVAPSMLEVVRMGPMAEQCRSISSVLTNSKLIHYVIVTIDTELSINESIELFQAIKAEKGLPSVLLMNRCFKSPIPEPQLKNCVDTPGAAQDFCKFLKNRLQRQLEGRQKIEQTTGTTVTELPLVPSSDPVQVKNVLADAFSVHLELPYVG